ncbi:MAG TPA: response regulator [Symbiobacteriaceae bacterium]|nr:response regulator [Symbiobacteriaceae bacterium]
MSKILVVDPSPVDRKRMRSILEAAGHNIIETASPDEAIRELDRLPRGSVVLVLSELYFPEGSGMDLVRWVARQGGTLPVLMVTVQPPREKVIELINSGVSTVITKPFGADMLLRRVTAALTELGLLRQGEGANVSWQITDYIRRELKRAERSGSDFSVAVCRLADTLGGRAVPALMTGLAAILRESDVLARLGDNQIVILLPDTDSVGAWAVEDRVWQVVRSLAEERPDRPAVHLTVSTGAATFPSEAADADVLLRLAVERASRRAEVK